MGMAASQSRLLQLTVEFNNNSRKLQHLSLEKMSLTRSMNVVSREYQSATSAKKFQWLTGSANYVDLTYSTLMSPSAANGNKPYLITDQSGRVVVDNKYKKYAEMISPTGAPANWEDHKSEVLATITGLDQQDIENYDGYYLAFLDNKRMLEELEESEPLNRSAFIKQNTNSFKELLGKIGSSGGISDWASAYDDSNSKIPAGNIGTTIDDIKNKLSKYFMEGSTKFEEACDAVKVATTGEGATDVTVKELMDRIKGAYKAKGGQFAGAEYTDPNGNTNPVWYDVDTEAYTQYKQKHDEWEAARDEAKSIMEASLNNYNLLFTADESSLIKFYDALFSSIAEKGWVQCSNVSEPSYLNEMFQNNMFYVTSVDRELNDSSGSYSYDNTYSTDLATNCSKMVQVSNSEYRDTQLLKYEDKKRKITDKENAIDLRMKTLETRNQAITSMKESIQNTLQKNIENHMNIFT